MTLMSCGALSLASLLILALESYGDTIQMGGDEQLLLTRPLDSYFDTHPGAKPEPDVYTTGGWRQYEAEWELTGDSLFLIDLRVLRHKEGYENWVTFDTLHIDGRKIPIAKDGWDSSYSDVSVLAEVFPDWAKVPATWFTGYLVVPSGDEVAACQLHRSHKVHERYSVSIIVDGFMRDHMGMAASEFCGFWEGQFRRYQKTTAYEARASSWVASSDSLRAIGKDLGIDYAGEILETDFETYMTTLFDDRIYRK